MDFAPRPDRRPVELNGYTLLSDGSTIEASLLDLSYEGCKIRSAGTLRPGDMLKLSVFRLGLIEAEVRWFEDGVAGLAFSAVEDAPAPKQWPRRSERACVTADVTLRKAGQPSYRVRVLDASPEGCKVEFVDRPVQGDRVWIKFAGLETLEAEVCWVDASTMGLQFARSMHPAVFDLLLQRLAEDD
jgi:transposase